MTFDRDPAPPRVGGDGGGKAGGRFVGNTSTKLFLQGIYLEEQLRTGIANKSASDFTAVIAANSGATDVEYGSININVIQFNR